jgi:hypothetical protein
MPLIKKGITLRVRVYVEGMDEAAHDFSAIGQDVLNKVIQAGVKSAAGPYTVTVQKIEPLEGSDASDEEVEGDADEVDEQNEKR